jgi:hypothetical protein
VMEVGRWVRVDEDLGAYRWCRSARWIPRRTLVAPLSASSSFVGYVRTAVMVQNPQTVEEEAR